MEFREFSFSWKSEPRKAIKFIRERFGIKSPYVGGVKHNKWVLLMDDEIPIPIFSYLLQCVERGIMETMEIIRKWTEKTDEEMVRVMEDRGMEEFISEALSEENKMYDIRYSMAVDEISSLLQRDEDLI